MSATNGSIVGLIPSKPIFTMIEVMEILGVSRDTLEQELRSGRMAFKRMGQRRIGIPHPALVRYLETFDTYPEEVKDVLPWE